MIVLREVNQIKITDAAQVAAVFRDLLALEDAIARDTEHYFVMHLDTRHTVKLGRTDHGLPQREGTGHRLQTTATGG